jgi:hypothetical protein
MSYMPEHIRTRIHVTAGHCTPNMHADFEKDIFSYGSHGS